MAGYGMARWLLGPYLDNWWSQTYHIKCKNGTTYPSYTNYCLKGEISITFHFQLCSTCYTAIWIIKKELCNQCNCYEKLWIIPVTKWPVISKRWSVHIELHFQLDMLNLLAIHSYRLFEKNLWHHYETFGQFQLQKEAITCHHQLTLFAVSKDEWDTVVKKPEECIVCTYCCMLKGTSWAVAMLNNEKSSL